MDFAVSIVKFACHWLTSGQQVFFTRIRLHFLFGKNRFILIQNIIT